MKKSGRGRSAALQRNSIALAVASCFVSGAALANPTGAQVKSGNVTFQQSGNVLQITNTPNAVIHWQGFSIGQSEVTRFVQQSAASAVLNRVVGANPSAILGALQSNGRVFLINPNGIVFGAGATVDVAGLVASTLNLTDGDFIAGRMRFGAQPGAGNIVNEGAITTASGGQVYLIAPNVTNSGVITTPKGEVVIAAGRTVEMADARTPLLRVEVTAPDNEAVNVGKVIADGGRVSVYGTAIRNKGEIRANTLVRGENGEILLKAKKDITLEKESVITASGPSAGKITIEAETGSAQIAGRIEANATVSPPAGGGVAQGAGVVVGEKGGTIDIRAARDITVDARAVITANGASGGQVTIQSAQGTTKVAGRIEARGLEYFPPATVASPIPQSASTGQNGNSAEAAGAGGTVHVLGETVALTDNATVDVSGTTGGGTILIGGDYQGKNPRVQNAKNTWIGAGALLNADATILGGGGKVIVWADKATHFRGAINARGGVEGGDGGFVETSGKGFLLVTRAPDVSTRRRGYRAGTWLLDPTNINIVAIDSPGTPDTEFNAGVFQESGVIDAASEISIAVLAGALASGNVVINTASSVTGPAGNITWQSGANLNYNNAGSKSLTLNADNNITIAGNITDSVAGGDLLNLTLNPGASGTTTISSQIALSGGTLTVGGTNAATLANGGTIVNATMVRAAGQSFATAASSSSGTLDGVTLGAGFTVTSGTTLNVRNGLNLGGHKVTLTPGPGNTLLTFVGNSQTLSGPGEVVFAGTGAAGGFLDQNLNASQTLTIGSGVLVHGATGGSPVQIRLSSGPITNNGTISADVSGQTISFNQAGTLTNNGIIRAQAANVALSNPFVNAGTLDLANAHTLTLGSGVVAWSNTGTILAQAGTLNLDGSFTDAALGNVVRTGAQLRLTGTLNNAGNNFTLTTARTGSMTFSTGSIVNGGTLTAGAGTVLATEVSNSATFNGVTLGADFTVSSGSTLNVSGGLNLSGHKVTLTPGPGNSLLTFIGNSQTLSGPGEVVFAGTGAAGGFLDQNLNASQMLTIGSGVLVHGATGGSPVQIRLSSGPITNNGTISADVSGQTISFNQAGTLTNNGIIRAQAANVALSNPFVNAGTLDLANAHTLTLGSGVVAWSNTGTILAQAGTLNLDGSFTDAALGNVVRTGAQLRLTGTLNNAGNNFTLTTARTGSMTFSTGAIVNGGTLTAGAGTVLATEVSNSSTFNGVTLGSDFTVSSGSTLNVSGGLNLNGNDLRLTPGPGNSLLTFIGNSQTLSGPGEVVFAGTGSAGGFLDQNLNASQTLTIGSGVLVHGATGGSPVQIRLSSGPITNNGTISADVSGQTISFNQAGTLTNNGIIRAQAANVALSNPFVNAGTLDLANAHTLTLGSGVVAWSNTGTILAQAGTLNLDGSFTDAALGNVVRTGAQLRLTGTLNNAGNNFTLTTARTGSMTFSTGSIVNGGTLTAGAGTVLATEVSNSATFNGVTLGADFTVSSGSTLNVSGGLNLSGHKVTLTPGPGNTLLTFIGNSQTLSGPGEVVFAGTGAAGGFLDQNLTNATHTLTIASNVLVHGATGGSNAQIRLSLGPITNNGTIWADVAGQTIAFNQSHALTNNGTLRASNGGAISATSTAFPQNAGVIDIGAGSTFSTSGAVGTTLTNLSTGIIRGNGTLIMGGANRALTNNGTINAGASPGTLAITGDLVLTPTSVTNIEIQGPGLAAGTDYDLITVSGTATLGGTLNVLGSFSPGLGQTFQIVTYAARTGNFTIQNFPTTGYTATPNPTNYQIAFGTSSTNTWIATSGSWQADSNWSLGHAPTATENVVIPDVGGAGINQTITVSASGQNALSITSAETLAIASGGVLTLHTGGTSTINAPLTMNTGTLVNNGALTVHTLNLNSGTLTGDGSVTVSNAYTRAGGTFSIGGAASITQAVGNLTLAHAITSVGLTLNAGGTIGINSGATLALGGGNLTIGNLGGAVLNGGTISNGTVRNPGGSGLTATGSSSMLNGVTLDTDVAVPGSSTQLTVQNGLTFANGHKVVLQAGAGGYAQLSFTGASQTVGGTGIVEFAGTGSNTNYFDHSLTSGQTLTIGPNVTLQGATGGSSVQIRAMNGPLVNNGAIRANVSGRTIDINDSGPFTNNGTLQATNGGTMVVNPTSWSNTGVLSVGTGSRFNLDGSLTVASVEGHLQNTGGTFYIVGVINNAGGTLTANTNTGNIRLGTGGVISGGTLASADGASFIVDAGTLSGVTLDTDIVVPGSNTLLAVQNNLTFANGHKVLLQAGAGGYAQLSFTGSSQTVGGTGMVEFAGTGSNTNYFDQSLTSGQTLTIGPNVTLQGATGGSNAEVRVFNGPLVNNGAIRANVSGRTIDINSTGPFTNNGTLQATNGGTMVVNPTSWSNTGVLSVGTGSRFNLDGSLPGASVEGHLQNTGGTFYIVGVINNAGGTLTANTNTGNIRLGTGGVISGGTLASADGALFIVDAGTLSGVTLDTDIVVPGNSTQLTVQNNLTFANGHKVVLQAGAGGYAQLSFTGSSQTVGGTGMVEFAGTGSNTNYFDHSLTSGQTLTIGPNVTLQGATGGSNAEVRAMNGPLANNGAIRANVSGRTIDINNAGPFTNNGTLQATNGGTMVVNPTSWSNTGVLSVGTGSRFNLDGSLPIASVEGRLQSTGGTFYITGAINNAAGTFTANATTGNIHLASGGMISGGTLASAGGASFIVDAGTLSGVTLNTDIVVPGSSTQLTVQNGLTFANGHKVVLQAGAGGYAQLSFIGSSQTVGGTGMVEFAGTGSNTNYFDHSLTSGQTLTIGPNVTLQGATGGSRAEVRAMNGPLTNNGTISANVSGREVQINSTGPFTNNGTVQATNGGTLTTGSAFGSNVGVIVVAAGSTWSTGNTSVSNTGIIRSAGSISVGTGTLTIASGGSFRPGASPGLTSITGHFALASGSNTQIEISGYTRGADPGYDAINVTGNVTISNGATFTVLHQGGFAASVGDSFRVITAGGSLTNGGTLAIVPPSGGEPYAGGAAGSDFFLQRGTTFTGVNVWISNNSGLWSDPANWSAGLPGANQTVIIDRGTFNPVITVSSGTQFTGVLQSTEAIVVSAGTLTVSNNSTTSGSFTLSGGTLNGTGTLTLSGASNTWSGGTMSGAGVSGAGATTIANGATLNVNGSATVGLDQRVLNNAGVMIWTNTATANEGNGAVFNNSGVLDLRSNTTWSHNLGGANATFNNTGTVLRTIGGGTMTLDPVFNNQAGGTVSVTTGTLSLNGGGTDVAPFAVGTGAVLRFGGNSTHNLNAGAAVSGAGTVGVNAGTVNFAGGYTPTTTIIDGGTANFNTASSATNLTLSSGTLGGSGTLTVNGASTWTGGTMSGTGATTIANTSTLTVSGGNAVQLSQRTLNNAGLVNWTNTVTANEGNGAVVNNTGTFDFRSGATWSHNLGGANATFNNAGTVLRSVAAGTTTLDPVFNNQAGGTVSVNSGTLSLNGGGTDVAPFTVGTGAVLRFGGNGTHNLNAGAGVSGAGTVEASGGTVSFAGGYTPTATIINGGTVNFNAASSTTNLILSSGTLSGSGTLTVNGASTWSGGTMNGAGATTFASTSVLAVSGGNTVALSQRTLNNAGSVIWTNTVTANEGNGAVINNTGTFDFRSNTTWSHNLSGANATFNNGGTVLRTVGVGTLTLDPVFNNQVGGTVSVTSGTFALSGGGTDVTPFTVGTGAVLRFGGGTHNLNAGALVSGAGTVEVSGGTASFAGGYTPTATTINGGTASFNAASSTTNLTFSSGFLGGSGTFTVNGASTWTGGRMTGSGATTFAASVTVSGGNTVGLDQRTLNNAGTMIWTNTVTTDTGNGAVFNNSGTLDLRSDSAWTHNLGGANATLNNSGTVVRTVGTGTMTLNPVFNNQGGTVSVNTGTLSLNGGGTDTTPFAAGAGATLRFGGGTHNLNAGAAVSGAGTVAIDGGTVNFGGIYSAAATSIGGGAANFNAASSTTNLTFSSGFLGGSGTFTVNGASTWTGGRMTGSGATTIASGATVAVSGGNTVGFDQRTLNNAGVMIWANTVTTDTGNGAVINNTGTLDLRSDSTWAHNLGGANATLNNTGSVLRTVGTGTMTLNPVFDNQAGGFLEVRSGTLRLNNTGTNAGTLAGSATLNLAGGTGTLTSTGTIAPGTAADPTGTLTIQGNLTQGASSQVNIQIGGASAGDFDVLAVTGTHLMTNGTLNASSVNGFTGPATNLALLTFGGRGGTQFAAVNSTIGGFVPTYNATSLTANVGVGGDNFWLPLTSGDWDLDTNWSLGHAPLGNENAIIDVAGLITVTIPASALTGQQAATLTSQVNLVIAGQSLTLGGPSTINGLLTISGGTLQGSGAVAANGGLNFTGGTLAGNVTVTGTTSISAGAPQLSGTLTINVLNMTSGAFSVLAGGVLTVNGAANSTVTASAFMNAGTVNWTGTGNLLLSNAAAFTNSGRFNFQGDAGIQYDNSGGVPLFTNSGTLAKTAGTTSFIGLSFPINFVNSGTLLAQTGTLDYGATNTFNNGSVFTGAGVNLVTTSSTFNGTITSANLTLQSGDFSGTGSLAGTTTWTGGRITGALTIPSGATLIGSGAGNKTVSAATVTNAGTVDWTGTGNLILTNGATFANSARFNFQSDAGVQYDNSGAVPTFNNTGTLAKTGGSVSVVGLSFLMNFTNSGTLLAQTGTLNYAAANSFNDGSVFSGAGSNLVTSNSTFNGSVTSSGNLTLQSGDFGGTANLAGTTTWSGGRVVGALTIPTGATLTGTGTGPKTVSIGTMTNAGTVNWTGIGNLLLTNGGTFANAGRFNFQGDAGVQYDNSGAVPTFNNMGTLAKTAGGTSVVGLSFLFNFSNSGTLLAQTGTLNYAAINDFRSGSVFSGAGSNVVTSNSNFDGTVTSSGNLVLQSGNFSGTANLAGTTTWTGGTVIGALTIPSGATLTASGGGAKRVSNAVMTNAGIVNWTDTGNLLLTNGGTFVNNSGGRFNFVSDAGVQYDNSGAVPTFNNMGTLAKTAGGTSVVGLSFLFNFTNSGTLLAQTGTLNYAANNAFNGGSVFSGAGSNLVTGNSTFSGTVTSSSNLTLQSGIFSGTGTLAGATTWTGGTMAGALTVGAGATLTGSGAGAKTISSSPLTNAGTVNWTGTGHLLLTNGGSFLNNGRFDFQSDAGVQYNNSGGVPTFTNAGTLIKTGGSGESLIGASFAFPFTNAPGGLVDVQAGTVRVASGLAVNNGTITTAANTTFSNSGLAMTNAGVIGGNGTLAIGAALLNTGTIGGGGTIGSSVVTSQGTIAAGASAGTLTFTGDLVLDGASGSVVRAELGGTTPGTQHDVINVLGEVRGAGPGLANWGTLNVTHLPGFTPTSTPPSSFTIMNYGSKTGDFTTVNFPSTFAYTRAAGAASYQLGFGVAFANTWVGTGGVFSGDWETASNWSLGHVPQAGEDVIIPDRGLAGVTEIITVNAGSQVARSITNAEQLRVLTGDLTFTQSSTSTGTIAVAGGTLTGTDASLNTHTLNVTAGALNLTGTGTLAVTNAYSQTGGTVSVAGNASINQASGPLALGAITAANLTLASAAGATQGGGPITANGLRITGGGAFVLNDAINDVATLAADLGAAGSLNYRDANGLNIGTVQGTSGIVAGTVTVTAGGALTNATGTTDITANAITLTAAFIGATGAGRVTLDPNGGAGTVTATSTAGGIFIEQVTGNALISNYDLAAPGQVIEAATRNGSIIADESFGAGLTEIRLITGGPNADIVFGAGVTVASPSLTLSRTGTGGRVVFNSGSVTINRPVTASMPVSIDGATVSFNDTTVLSGLTLTAGSLGGSGLVILNGGSTWTGGTMSGSGTTRVAGTLDANAGVGGTLIASRPFENQGAVNVNGGTLQLNSFPANSGTINIAAGATFSTNGASLTNNGSIGGSGTIELGGQTLTNRGIVVPGSSPGKLTINGDYVQMAGATLRVELAGTDSGYYDVLRVNGTATLDGILAISLMPGYIPLPDASFPVVEATTVSGAFATITPPAQVSFGASYHDTSVSIIAGQSGIVAQPVVAALQQTVDQVNNIVNVTETVTQVAARETAPIEEEAAKAATEETTAAAAAKPGQADKKAGKPPLCK